VPPLLLTSSRRRTISHFLSIESRWARSLWFIFWQRFVPSSPLLSQNWSIKSTPPLHATLPGLSDSPSIAIKISFQSWSLSSTLNCVFILPPLESEHHAIEALCITIILFYWCLTPIIHLHNDTHDNEVSDPLTLQITYWHVNSCKKYFKIP
jgi:hypothetical protein